MRKPSVPTLPPPNNRRLAAPNNWNCPRCAPVAPVFYIEMDGTGAPVVKSETEGRAGKVEGPPARTREAKLGCVFTQTTTDQEGRPIRDENSTTYTAAIETAEEFGLRLYTEAWRRGWSRARKKGSFRPSCFPTTNQTANVGRCASSTASTAARSRLWCRLLRAQRRAYALPGFPCARSLGRLRSRGSGLQDRDRLSSQTLRHVLDRPRRQRDHRAAVLLPQQPIRRLLGIPLKTV